MHKNRPTNLLELLGDHHRSVRPGVSLSNGNVSPIGEFWPLLANCCLQAVQLLVVEFSSVSDHQMLNLHQYVLFSRLASLRNRVHKNTPNNTQIPPESSVYRSHSNIVSICISFVKITNIIFTMYLSHFLHFFLSVYSIRTRSNRTRQ